MKRAIVLSGGGARGAYQMGVWKALRKLNIKYHIVTGSSVGALNGALMTQNTYFKGLWFWYNIKSDSVFRGKNIHKISSKESNKEICKKCFKAIVEDRGLECSCLEETIDKILDEDKLRNSKIDFGLTTFNLTTLKPIKLTKKDVPKGKLRDYLMASATCFPAFKKKNIDGEHYIDGAYYDNLPMNLAVEMGADEIIAVDLKSLGFKRKLKEKNIKVTYIKPRNKLVFFLVFHKHAARRGIRLGYNDTMKTFNKLDGDKFTFKHGNLTKNYKRYKTKLEKELNRLMDNKKSSAIGKVLKATYKKEISIDNLTKIIDFLGKSFELNDSLIYDIDKFNKILSDKISKMEPVDKKTIKQKIKSGNIKGLIKERNMIKYIYDEIETYNKVKSSKELSNITLLFPKEFLAAIYLFVINK